LKGTATPVRVLSFPQNSRARYISCRMFPRPELVQLIAQLGRNPFFQGLGELALNDLAREAVWREHTPGEVVFLEGEAALGLYYLQFGWLKAVKSSPEGREQVLRFIGPGETFNEIGAFASRPNPATAIALEAAGVWLLRREAMLRLLRRQPDLAQRIIEGMADRVIDLANLVADLSLRPVTGRLARLLLDEADGDVLHRPRWHTQAELAARLGTVPDVVQRALRGLETEGAIEVHRHEIRIRNRAALEKLAA
jgi:CRP/FNR family transcriptional regulator